MRQFLLTECVGIVDGSYKSGGFFYTGQAKQIDQADMISYWMKAEWIWQSRAVYLSYSWSLSPITYLSCTWSHKGYMKCELLRRRGIWNTLDPTRGIWNVNSCMERVYEIHLIAQRVYEMWTNAQKGYMEHTWLHNGYMNFLCIADEEYEYMHGSKQPIRSWDCSTVQDKSTWHPYDFESYVTIIMIMFQSKPSLHVDSQS